MYALKPKASTARAAGGGVRHTDVVSLVDVVAARY